MPRLVAAVTWAAIGAIVFGAATFAYAMWIDKPGVGGAPMLLASTGAGVGLIVGGPYGALFRGGSR